MVDFKKLNDPVWIAETRAAREAEEREAEIGRGLVRNALDRCERAADWIGPKERAFVESCRRQFESNFNFLSQKQLKRLGDIEHWVDGRLGIITVSSGMRGFFAVHMRTGDDSDGQFYPEQSGIGSYSSAEAASLEAMNWAESEQLRYEAPGTTDEPVLLKPWLEKRALAVKGAQAPPQTIPVPAGDGGAPAVVNSGRRAILAARAKSRSGAVSASEPSMSEALTASGGQPDNLEPQHQARPPVHAEPSTPTPKRNFRRPGA